MNWKQKKRKTKRQRQQRSANSIRKLRKSIIQAADSIIAELIELMETE